MKTSLPGGFEKVSAQFAALPGFKRQIQDSGATQREHRLAPNIGKDGFVLTKSKE